MDLGFVLVYMSPTSLISKINVRRGFLVVIYLLYLFQEYKNTIDILRKFGELLKSRKKVPKKQELPANIVKIADYLKNIKKTA